MSLVKLELSSGRPQSNPLSLLTDQAVSSGTNFVSLALIAGASGADEFGSLALGTLTFTTMIALTRAGLGEVTLLGDLSREDTQRAAWGIGIGTASLLILAAVLLDGSPRTAALLTAVALPGGLAQDMSRWAEMRTGTARRALASDSTWLLALVTVASLLHLFDVATGPRLYAGWVLSIYLSLWAYPELFGAWRFASQGLRALYRVRITAIDSVGQAGITNLLNLVLFALLGLTTSLEVVGAVRGAWLLFGPTHVLTAAVSVIAVSRISRTSTGRVRQRVAASATFVLTTAVAVWGGLLLLLPYDFGTRLLGITWAPVSELRTASLALFIAVALGSGATFLLRANRHHKKMLRVYLAMFPLTLGLPLFASSRWEAIGFLAGSTISTVSISLIMIRLAAGISDDLRT